MDETEIDDLVEALGSRAGFRRLMSRSAKPKCCYKAGASIKDLAAQFEINRRDQIKEVCRLYQTGLTSSAISMLFDVSAYRSSGTPQSWNR